MAPSSSLSYSPSQPSWSVSSSLFVIPSSLSPPFVITLVVPHPPVLLAPHIHPTSSRSQRWWGWILCNCSTSPIYTTGVVFCRPFLICRHHIARPHPVFVFCGSCPLWCCPHLLLFLPSSCCARFHAVNNCSQRWLGCCCHRGGGGGLAVFAAPHIHTAPPIHTATFCVVC